MKKMRKGIKIRHTPAFFRSSLAKSELAWLRHEKLKFEVEIKVLQVYKYL